MNAPNPTGGAALTPCLSGDLAPAHAGVYARRAPARPYACWDGGLARASTLPCATCRGATVVDRGVDAESGTDLIAECPDC